MLAIEVTALVFHVLTGWLKLLASLNIIAIVVAALVSQVKGTALVPDAPLLLNAPANKNMLDMSVTLLVSHVVSGWLNAVVLSNMLSILVTAPVFHAAKGWLNADAPRNMLLMLVTPLVSHAARGLLKIVHPRNVFAMFAVPVKVKVSMPGANVRFAQPKK